VKSVDADGEEEWRAVAAAAAAERLIDNKHASFLYIHATINNQHNHNLAQSVDMLYTLWRSVYY